MMNIWKLKLLWSSFIEDVVPDLTDVSSELALLSSPGGLGARTFEWDALSFAELNFKGYARLPWDTGGTGSAWLPMIEDGVSPKTQTLDAHFAYDSGESGTDVIKTAYYLVWLGEKTGDGEQKIIAIWQCPEVITFEADGDEHTWALTMFDINVEDV